MVLFLHFYAEGYDAHDTARETRFEISDVIFIIFATVMWPSHNASLDGRYITGHFMSISIYGIFTLYLFVLNIFWYIYSYILFYQIFFYIIYF